jgi:hypothetical protein
MCLVDNTAMAIFKFDCFIPLRCFLGFLGFGMAIDGALTNRTKIDHRLT